MLVRKELKGGETTRIKWASVPIVDRFMEKIKIIGECWIWTGAKTKHGYGYFRTHDNLKKKVERAHRVS